jgi:aerobic-type carbon monoxide dehydrogenase small subunit (CoxS/CutS family)
MPCARLLVRRCRGATSEGLGQVGDLSDLQLAFVERDALQCGYCTPGQVGSPAAIGNAIFNATGRRLRTLSFTPDKLLAD